MRRRYVLGMCTVAPLACVLLTASSLPQQKSLKEQLVGAWTMVSSSTKLPDGSPAWGANRIGLLILTDNGRYSSQVMRPDLPKFASNSRTQGTPDEYKAVVNGREALRPSAHARSMKQTRPSLFDMTAARSRTGKEPRIRGLS